MNAYNSIVTVSQDLRDVLFKKKKKRQREKVLKVTLGNQFFLSYPFSQALDKPCSMHAGQDTLLSHALVMFTHRDTSN